MQASGGKDLQLNNPLFGPQTPVSDESDRFLGHNCWVAGPAPLRMASQGGQRQSCQDRFSGVRPNIPQQ